MNRTDTVILVTGAAGFIGYHVARRLLERGDQVLGVDNLSDYYDVRLKEARLAQLESSPRFRFIKLEIADRSAVRNLFSAHPIRRVVHLAAQAGVRYSLVNPHAYADSNLVGFLNILEGCRQGQAAHLVFASSSSVYGGNTKMPFSEHDNVDHPLSLYGASKKANELMAHSYAHLYGLPCTGLRFFTVYGPWGRPDMALFLFTKAILEGKPIDVFNHGKMQRDFTYVDDIVEGVVRVLDRPLIRTAPGRRRTLPRARPPIASTTSGITSRWRSCESSSCWNRPWGKKRRSTCSRCSQATSRPRTPTWTTWSSMWRSNRIPPSKSASGDSWNGTEGTIRFEDRLTGRAGAADPRTRPSGPAAPRAPRRAGPRDTWWRGRRPTSRRLGPRGYRLVSPR